MLITVDRVLNANILATRLDPNPNLSELANFNFEALKTEIKMIEITMLPLSTKKLKKDDKLWPNKVLSNKMSNDGMDFSKIERMIDLYLVK